MRTTIINIIFIQLFTSTYLLAQYGDLGIKDRFDVVYDAQYKTNWDDNSWWNANAMYTSNYYDRKIYQDRLGSTLSGSLDALLVMYEATCDMKYLYEFMKRSVQVQNARADRVNPVQSGSPYWFRDQIPWHGRILTSQAHFVVLVDEEGLYNIPLPQNTTDYGGKSSIGEMRDWINESNQEVMDFLIPKYWRSENECFCKPQSFVNGCPNTNTYAINKNCYYSNCSYYGPEVKSISELNYQGAYGTALLYMFVSNTNRVDYGVKVVEMARAYLIEDGGILTYGIFNNYTWYHDGWQQIRTTFPSPGTWEHENDDGIEDIGHAYFDLSFPILYNKYYSHITGQITGNQYFEDYILVRFKNTFSNLVYNSTGSVANENLFNYFVDGTTNNSVSFDKIRSAAKMWTELYLYDDVTGSNGGDVYNILMDYYSNYEQYDPINEIFYGGARIKGLADMCKANYTKEGLRPKCYIPGRRIESKFRIYPNPSSDGDRIMFSYNKSLNDDEIVQIRVFNSLGKLLLDKSFKANEEASLEGLSSGVYFCELEVSGNIFIEKIVVNDI